MKIDRMQLNIRDPSEVDFEQIMTEIGNILTEDTFNHEVHYYELNEELTRDWSGGTKKLAGTYSWKNWQVSGFPVAKVLLDLFQVGALVARNPYAEVIGVGSRSVATIESLFQTTMTGTRTELSEMVAKLKELFSKTQQNQQSARQQVQEALRKIDDARRNRESTEAAMAR